ncbi:hypothetical protein KCP73_25770 [Salmonella enterica subsp. enterica]|nr:hypothetical protein KCP73_25770 [Salmonella enterica subsp. enterica]
MMLPVTIRDNQPENVTISRRAVHSVSCRMGRTFNLLSGRKPSRQNYIFRLRMGIK